MILGMLFISFFLMVFPGSAFAYLDPGTVSYFIQALVAILAGVGYATKLFWSQIKRFFASIFGGKKNNGDSSGSN